MFNWMLNSIDPAEILPNLIQIRYLNLITFNLNSFHVFRHFMYASHQQNHLKTFACTSTQLQGYRNVKNIRGHNLPPPSSSLIGIGLTNLQKNSGEPIPYVPKRSGGPDISRGSCTTTNE